MVGVRCVAVQVVAAGAAAGCVAGVAAGHAAAGHVAAEHAAGYAGDVVGDVEGVACVEAAHVVAVGVRAAKLAWEVGWRWDAAVGGAAGSEPAGCVCYRNGNPSHCDDSYQAGHNAAGCTSSC